MPQAKGLGSSPKSSAPKPESRGAQPRSSTRQGPGPLENGGLGGFQQSGSLAFEVFSWCGWVSECHWLKVTLLATGDSPFNEFVAKWLPFGAFELRTLVEVVGLDGLQGCKLPL